MIAISSYSELQYTQSIHANYELVPYFQVIVVII